MSWPELDEALQRPLPPDQPPRYYRLLFWAAGIFMVAFVVGGALLPETLDVQRTRVIAASPDKIYALLSEPALWEKWAPWFQRNPFLDKKATGNPSGNGAQLAWQGNGHEGRLKVTSSMPVSAVRIKADLAEQGEVDLYMNLKPVPGGTEVTWGLRSEFGRNYGRRYHGLLMRSTVATEVEAGLTALDDYLAQNPRPVPGT